MTNYLGTIALFSYERIPQGWVVCSGQHLNIAGNQSLFSIIGYTYGRGQGDMFVLPDLRGRSPIGATLDHATVPDGLTVRPLGEYGGEAKHVLSAEEMAEHTHEMFVSDTNAEIHMAQSGNAIATPTRISGRDKAAIFGYNTKNTDASLASSSVASNSGGEGHNNMQPYLGMQYAICIDGEFPSR